MLLAAVVMNCWQTYVIWSSVLKSHPFFAAVLIVFAELAWIFWTLDILIDIGNSHRYKQALKEIQ